MQTPDDPPAWSALPAWAELAWSLRMAEPQTTRQLARDKRGCPQAQALLAYLAWRGGEYAQALEHALDAETTLRARGEQRWLARTLNILAVIYGDIGQRERAVRCNQEQLALAEATGDLDLQATALIDMGVSLHASDVQQARTFYQAACDVYRQVHHSGSAAQGLALVNLSAALWELGECGRSEALAERGGQLILAQRAWPYWAGYVALRCAQLGQAQDYGGVRRLVTDALERSPELPVESRLVLTLSLADTELTAGQPGAALALLSKLADVWEARREYQPEYLSLLARSQAQLGDYAAAYQAAQKLLSVREARYAQERQTQLLSFEVLYRTQAVQAQAAQLETRLGEVRALQAETLRLSVTDALTGLGNRRALLDQGEVHRAAGRALVLAFMDVDDFKQVNDQLGHDQGDLVLQFIADLLRRQARSGDVLARLGGDEFVLLRSVANEPGTAGRNAPGLNTPDMDAAEAELLSDLQRVRAAFLSRDWPLRNGARLGLSIGVARLGEATLLDGLREADARMYAAKRAAHRRAAPSGQGRERGELL